MSRISLAILCAVGVLGLAYACIDSDGGGDKSLEIGDAGLISGLGLSYQAEMDKDFGKMPQQVHADSPALRHDTLVGVAGLLDAELRKSGVEKETERTATVAAAMHALFAEETPWKSWPKEAQAKLERVPAEFMIYIRSLDENQQVALAETEKLLALPEAERRNLTALAHYRKGRLLTLMTDWEKITDDAAKPRIREIRACYESALKAIATGVPDIARVGAAAEGWLAHSKTRILPYGRLAELGEADAAGALRTYLDLRRRGESMGESSAYILIRELSDHGSRYGEFAKDDDLRTLMTIYLCAGGNRRIGDEGWSGEGHAALVTSWTSALEAMSGKAAKDASRIALLLYNTGQYDRCARVLEQCASDDTTTAMLRSRLALRQGKKPEAAKALQQAVEKLPPLSTAPFWGSNWYDRPAEQGALIYIDRSQIRSIGGKARAELAVLRHSEGNYIEAMRLYLLSGQEWAATYLAECVLSIEELKSLVDKELMTARLVEKSWGEPDDLNASIRQLLGRRLCRAGRWGEALPYLGAHAQEAMRHIDFMRIAADASLPNRQRADAYWRSARIMFKDGYFLLYCPFGESHSSSSGWSMGEWPLCRIKPTEENPLQRIATPSEDEARRVQQWWDANLAKPNRAHRLGKYEGLRLTLLAAALLPDNDPAGGEILNYAGQTLMYVDPPAANAAYKVLATRFKETPEGKYAFENRWFKKRQWDVELPPYEYIITRGVLRAPNAEKEEGR